MRNRKGLLPVVWVCLLVCGLFSMGLFGCTGMRVAAESKESTEDLQVKRIAVLPFRNMYGLYGEGVTFRCPLCSKSYIIGRVDPGAEAFLAEELYSRLRERGVPEVIGPDQVQGAQLSALFSQPVGIAEKERILETGKHLEADAVAVGRVYRFSERSGTAYGSTAPASVSFDVLLIRVRDGRLLWDGEFTETQKPLSEDLFRIGAFLKNRGRWATARELARSGMQEMLGGFPVP